MNPQSHIIVLQVPVCEYLRKDWGQGAGSEKCRNRGCLLKVWGTASLPTARYLLAVSITEGQTEVVLLQEIEVLTDQVKQHLAPAVLLRKRDEATVRLVPLQVGQGADSAPPGQTQSPHEPPCGWAEPQHSAIWHHSERL